MLWQDRERSRGSSSSQEQSLGCQEEDAVIWSYTNSMSKNGVLKCMQISSFYVSLTTPFAAGICSARVDGARVGSAASVRIALISCRAGTDLCEKLTPDLNPMLTSYLSHRSIAS